MKWLWYGIAAAVFFGFWGLFDKLSAFQDIFASNFILYSAAFAVAILFVLFAGRIKFSKYSLLSGIFAGIGNFFVLYALVKNFVILVFPFVSLSAAAFFLIVYFTEKPRYTNKQKIFASFGLFLSFLGIFVVASGSVGFFNFIRQLTLDSNYIAPAVIFMFAFSLWTYFTYKSVAKERVNSATYSFWTILGSFIAAIITILVFSPGVFGQLGSLTKLGYIYPALGGIFVAFGAYCTYSAFKTTTTKTKLQEAIVAILANAELVPLAVLSYFVLGEKVVEGFVGTIILLLGLFLIHYAEVSK